MITIEALKEWLAKEQTNGATHCEIGAVGTVHALIAGMYWEGTAEFVVCNIHDLTLTEGATI